MPKIPGVNHLRAIKAFEKAGFLELCAKASTL
jgi:predicted RNA binding protein YcfA (HicA-like mRNA interferase family)